MHGIGWRVAELAFDPFFFLSYLLKM